jgi:predicted nuclease of predicted toxin-antitoxin system
VIRLLADENVPMASVHRLRNAGFDVAVVEAGGGDAAVLARAARESRVLLTFDRDFGKLALQPGAPNSAGLVYFRMLPAHPEEPAEMLLQLTRNSRMPLEGFLTVIQRARVRQRVLPRLAKQ